MRPSRALCKLQAVEDPLCHDTEAQGEEEANHNLSAIVRALPMMPYGCADAGSETEFRDLNRKLETLSATLQNIVDNKSINPSPASKLQEQVGELLATVKSEPDDDELYEGPSSFSSHSEQVASYFGEGITRPSRGNSTSRGSPSKTTSDATPPSSAAVATATGRSFPELAKLPLPPANFVLAALRYAKGKHMGVPRVTPADRGTHR